MLPDDQIPESDNFHQTSIHEITKIIKNLKNSNSVGWDNIPTSILKINVIHNLRPNTLEFNK